MSRPADDWGALMRGRIAMERLSARMIFGTGFMVRQLAKRRGEPVQDRVLDAHAAAMLRLDDLTGDSDDPTHLAHRRHEWTKPDEGRRVEVRHRHAIEVINHQR